MIVVGLSHKTAPIELREKLAVPPGRLADVLHRVCALPLVSEALVLSTCNRVEIYAAAERADAEQGEMKDNLVRLLAEVGGREVVAHLDRKAGPAALLHLFRLAASLESLVVGEPQILGQLKGAAKMASEAGTLGHELGSAVQAALHIAKQVRTVTAIGGGQVSVPSAAVDLARQIFHELRDKTTLLVGAGEMAETAARLLARTGTAVTVANRSRERAEKLAATVGGQPRPWAQLDEALVQADIVISSTASETYVVTAKQLERLRRRRRGRSLFIIDIAVPRDVEPSAHRLDNVYLYDIDDLSKVVASSLHERGSEATRAEAIVREGLRTFEVKRHQQAVKPVIVALRAQAQGALRGELERSCRGKLKHLSEQDRQALGKMLDAAVNKLLHAPTARLRDLASGRRGGMAASMLEELFDLKLPAGTSIPPPPDRESEATSSSPDGNEHSAAAR